VLTSLDLVLTLKCYLLKYNAVTLDSKALPHIELL